VFRAALFGFALISTALGQTIPPDLSPNCSQYSSAPLPPEAEQTAIPKQFPDCASYRSYRGIGRPRDYAKARACAWEERLAQKADLGQNPKELNAWVVGGSLILADLYFNGAGVPRNITLAMRFACEAEKAMVEIAVPEIVKQGTSSAHEPIEFCDYAATTFTMNFCGRYASEIGDDLDRRYFDSIKRGMTSEQRAAFEKLLSAQRAYVDAHASEVDHGGTIRTLRILGSQGILSNLFRTEVTHAERKKKPNLSDTEIAMADTWLRREYSKTLERLRMHSAEDIEFGAVKAEDLSNIQNVWETYRDAWAAFARLRYPEAAARVQAEITLERSRLLKTIR